jgi:hypothetical protein
MNEWLLGDYVKCADGRIYQVLRMHGGALYVQDVLRRCCCIIPAANVTRVSPKETAEMLVAQWLSSDLLAWD